ncbi:hypothetical protein [Nocardia rhizosphaerihabitans]|uniref:DUF8175 domain-containing protein n=1 Tax=Nocardia rhizosphaerihabitans TaxID=1691570 RepID=A0ABQ2K4C4_9NOCA|nr:hypothetical protein [Nocardia rhizosphaerihabitans]GGN66129.1 hypothetical protein GCM10011610_00760 [Nocardia rhizosphaerihabitans]
MPQNSSHPQGHGAVAVMTLAALLTVATGCAGTDTDRTTTSTTSSVPLVPSGVSWRSWQGIELPVAVQGPRLIDGAVASDFDRSPAGAALAAIHATVRMSLAPDGQWPHVGQRMLAPGPGRDKWATARAQVSISGPASDSVPSILGYTLTVYTHTEARVEIYSAYADDSVTRNTATVVWAVDGWRLLLPDPVTESPVTAVDSAPADMIPLIRP